MHLEILALCVTMLLSFVTLVKLIATTTAEAAGVSVGANPTPAIDIAVNLPSDYPGTFREVKKDLAMALVKKLPVQDGDALEWRKPERTCGKQKTCIVHRRYNSPSL